jgi:large subunit ribosomal protein L24
MSKIKKDDQVLIISGDDKGKKGRVLEVKPKDFLIKVQGIGLKTCHKKAKRQGEKSGKFVCERFIHISNVILV